MSKQKFAFDKTNFILLAVGMAVVILGFILMTGPVSTPTHFEPDIFSVRRIKVAPLVCLLGFVFMIYAVLRDAAGVCFRTGVRSAYYLVVCIAFHQQISENEGKHPVLHITLLSER